MKDFRDEERMSAYLDGEIPEEERERVEKWLKDQEGTEEDFALLQDVVQRVQRLPQDKAPDDFGAEIEHRIRKDSHGRYFDIWSTIRFPYDVLVSVTLVLAMVLVFLTGEQISDLEPIEASSEQKEVVLHHLNNELVPMGARAATSSSPVCPGGFEAWVPVEQVESARWTMPEGFVMESMNSALSEDGKQHLCFRPKSIAGR
jgi:anti-sigma factor RsiW